MAPPKQRNSKSIIVRITSPALVITLLSAAGCGAQGAKTTSSHRASSDRIASGGVHHMPLTRLASVPARGAMLRGEGRAGDWKLERPGVWHLIRPGDLPPPYATPSVDRGPRIVPRPPSTWPSVPPGFRVEQYASGLDNPRLIRTAPNGDLFVVESRPGRILVMRGVDARGKPRLVSTFATGLELPFGLAFYPAGRHPRYLYVGDTGAVLRFPYQNGALRASGPRQIVVPNIPSGGHLRGGGHWTRDLAFSRDGGKLFVSVGSFTNDHENPRVDEARRADILEYDPDGSGFRIFASGIRNAVGIAVNPQTGDLWASVNERDRLGDDVPPDYITRVKPGGFYGWPWFYIGPHQDPRHPGAHPELRRRVLIPDVLIQSHSASLEMTFYPGGPFPSGYDGDIFAAEHGSWNRRPRTGYDVIRVPLSHGRPDGRYQVFMSGFVINDGEVWGRPVGVAVGKDGSLLVSDDGSGAIWRVTYTGR